VTLSLLPFRNGNFRPIPPVDERSPLVAGQNPAVRSARTLWVRVGVSDSLAQYNFKLHQEVMRNLRVLSWADPDREIKPWILGTFPLKLRGLFLSWSRSRL
jgi:hypothetical protein